MSVFEPINPTRLVLLSALRFGPKRLRLCLVGERRVGSYRVPADIVMDAVQSNGQRILSGVLSFDKSTYSASGTLRVSRSAAELALEVDRLGPCLLNETPLPAAKLQTGLALAGSFVRAPSCRLELRLDFKQMWRDLY